MQTTLRPLLAEFIGAFGIVFMGSGAIMMGGRTGSTAGLLAAAIAYALTLAALVTAFARVSAHFNPAITIAHLITRRTPLSQGALMIVAQLLGAVAGAWVLKTTFPPDLLQGTRIGGTILASDVTFAHGVALEAVTTAILAVVVCAIIAQNAKPTEAGFTVGAVVGALIMTIGPLTGASFNPARSFGPALLSGVWEAHLVYWIGPVAGAIAGTVLWDTLLADRRTAGA